MYLFDIAGTENNYQKNVWLWKTIFDKKNACWLNISVYIFIISRQQKYYLSAISCVLAGMLISYAYRFIIQSTRNSYIVSMNLHVFFSHSIANRFGLEKIRSYYEVGTI